MSVGQSFAGDENGYSVFGAGSEGLRERSLRENAGRGGPAVDANCAHAFAAVSASGSHFEPSCNGLAAFRRRGRNAPGSCRKLPGT